MKSRAPIIALIICAVLFAAGLFQLLKLRFEAGDIYPPYSSLRADPLGAMAFYEALDRLPEMKVERDFNAANRLPTGRNTTYLQLGAQPYEWEWIGDDEFRTIQDFVTSGGRLVIMFFPELTRPVSIFRPDEQEEAREKSGQKTSDPKATPSKPARKRSVRSKSGRVRHQTSLRERWGIEIAFRELDRGTDTYDSALAQRRADLTLPESLKWHSALVFTNVSTNWQTIYARGTNVVIAERKFGAGSVVLAGDSFLVSNEAMVDDRQPELLSWLLGNSREVVFDEAHFGIQQTEGVATLLRKYHLYAVIGALLLLAVLFIWKNALAFVPPWEMTRSQPFVPGRETSAGFINLLRRNIPSRDLLKVCFTEWKKSAPKSSGAASTRQARAEALLSAEMERRPSDRRPLAVYQEICRTLKKL